MNEKENENDDDRIKRAALTDMAKIMGFTDPDIIYRLVDLKNLHVVRGVVIGVTETLTEFKKNYPLMFRSPGGTPPRDGDPARHGSPAPREPGRSPSILTDMAVKSAFKRNNQRM